MDKNKQSWKLYLYLGCMIITAIAFKFQYAQTEQSITEGMVIYYEDSSFILDNNSILDYNIYINDIGSQGIEQDKTIPSMHETYVTRYDLMNYNVSLTATIIILFSFLFSVMMFSMELKNQGFSLLEVLKCLRG